MNTLFLITARVGSKGIPFKNIKSLGGKPLITYSIDIARQFSTDDRICVSTDSDEIINVVENYGLKVPFRRPDALATDTAGSHEVILHAIEHFEKQSVFFDTIVLLQPTSPFRLKKHVEEALQLFNADIDMVVSVKKVKSNVYATFYRETENNFISKAFISSNDGLRRQDSEPLYELNGSIYIINVNSLKKSSMSKFSQVKKMVMEDIYSVDIDEPIDWSWCEFLLKENLVNLKSLN